MKNKDEEKISNEVCKGGRMELWWKNINRSFWFLEIMKVIIGI
jgi:hypothetical protein